jgi:O-antigen ligase
LYPISVDGNSINYSFALFPVISMLLYGKLRKPPNIVLLIVSLFTLIFFLATIYQFEFIGLGHRRLVSFVLFMTLFSFVFVKVDSEMIAAFKIAIVVVSVYFSLISISTFLWASAVGPIGYEAKDLVGSQRYGFIYLLALWIIFLSWQSGKLFAMGKYLVMGVVLAGMFLTFSRSSLVALMVGVGLFVFVSQYRWFVRPTTSGIIRGIVGIAAVCLLVFLIYHYLPLTFVFYNERLFELLGSGSLAANLEDPLTSEGTRIHIFKTILDFVIANPLTGSGYLGVWVLPDAFAGSAHNQYTDVLLRTGFIGFFAYCFLIFRVLKHLSLCERALFWGFISILVYGLFHETFKESQGGFILAFLMGMSYRFPRRSLGSSSTRPPHHVCRQKKWGKYSDEGL